MIEQNLGSNTKISLICRVVHMELNCELNKIPCLKISQETLYYKQQNKNSKNFMMSLASNINYLILCKFLARKESQK